MGGDTPWHSALVASLCADYVFLGGVGLALILGIIISLMEGQPQWQQSPAQPSLCSSSIPTAQQSLQCCVTGSSSVALHCTLSRGPMQQATFGTSLYTPLSTSHLLHTCGRTSTGLKPQTHLLTSRLRESGTKQSFNHCLCVRSANADKSERSGDAWAWALETLY